MGEERAPVTWDEHGNMVPLDASHADRHRLAAAEIAALQPKLGEHRIMSHKEFFYARALELARGFDAIVKPGEGYLETVFLALCAGLIIFLLRISVFWPVLLGMAVVLALFRLWVRVVVERKPIF